MSIPIKIITYPSRKEHVERFEGGFDVNNTVKLEEALSTRVATWPWFSSMMRIELAAFERSSSRNPTGSVNSTIDPEAPMRIICKISRANVIYFNQAKGNPLKNKAFEPFALDIDLATCFTTTSIASTGVAVVHFIQTATLTFVMIGWLCIRPMGLFKPEMAESPHRIITVYFLHQNSGRMHSIGNYFGGDAQVSPARLSNDWRQAISYTPFTLIEERFFNTATSKKRKATPLSAIASPPLSPIATAAAEPPGPHQMILTELIESMRSITKTKTSPATPFDWETWLDLPTLIANHWDVAVANTIENMYTMVLGRSSSDPNSSDFTKQFHTCIVFALFLYPFQMWSTLRLYTLSYALLPVKLRALATKFDVERFDERSVAAPSWIGLVTTIFAERILLPTIHHTLNRLIRNLEEAPSEVGPARFVQLYTDLQNLIKDQYGRAFLDLFGMPPIDIHSQLATEAAATRQKNVNCESFAKYIQMHVAHRSLAPPAVVSKSSNERPLLNECLIPLLAYFPYVILTNPIEDSYGQSKRIKTNFSVTSVAKGIMMAGKQQAPDQSSTTPSSSNLVIDIEDLATGPAPACLRRVFNIFKDASVQLVHADRLLILSSSFAAFAYLTGSTDTGEKWGKVPNPRHRQQIIGMTLELLKILSPRRYAYIQAKKDYGGDISGYIDLFAKKDDGTTYEQACACDPKRDQQIDNTKSTSSSSSSSSARKVTRAIGAPKRSSVQCPHLTAKGIKFEYSGEERKQALIACKRELGYKEETMNLNYAPHPFDAWVEGVVKLARTKQPRSH